MIVTPDRLSQVLARIEQGLQVDWQQTSDLQALDLAIAGRKFVEQAILANEQFNEDAIRLARA